MDRIAEVIINNSVRKLGKIYHYLIPNNLIPSTILGQVVSVPFGIGNRIEKGFIVGFVNSSSFENLKYIKEVLSDQELVSKNLMNLAFWMSKEYSCNPSDCIKLMLPPIGSVSISRDTIFFAKLKKSKNEIEEILEGNKVRGAKEREILFYILRNNEVKVSDILEETKASYSTIKNLEKKELIELLNSINDRSPINTNQYTRTTALTPNSFQGKAIKEISESIDQNKHAEYLIHGVTGSGKTEVYLQIISKVVEKNKQAIVLVPEISLTPQMIERFIGRFGDRVAIIHSKLSDGERRDQWYKIKEGKVDLVVGVRSAIFAPFENLGIIIIDEEHENTYKSEKSPRYHTKEVARKRCELENCVLVLGSATPSIETYYETLNKKINLIELPQRANKSMLPDVKIVDMRDEIDRGNKSIFSEALYKEISENIKRNEQTILFLNRRGYSNFVLCRKCGFVVKCNHCNVSLTYHINSDKLVCHYCGATKENYKNCPKCKSTYIKHFGIGTQKLEEEVKKAFEGVSVVRMDMDTTSKKDAHEQILKKFKNENINILIGTQMIAKGHDFPNVTLVGVISADLTLNLEDFRANEKTFQLLTQVAGRAGRANKPGRVIIQTYNGDHFSIQSSKTQDYLEFYKKEIILRSELKYPPYTDVISIMFNGIKDENVKNAAFETERMLRKELEKYQRNMIIFKPSPAPISKIKNRYRWRIIIKCKIDEKIKELIRIVFENKVLKELKLHNVNIGIDINPVSML